MDGWQKLLNRALSYIQALGLTTNDWALGGGTLLMLRYQHRHSRDIDIFLHDVQHLSYLSPRLNDLTAALAKGYTEAPNVLRIEYAEGEIDFLTVAPVFPGRKNEALRIPGVSEPVPSMPDAEVLGQKLLYRATGFTGRDLYDFVSVTRLQPRLLVDEELQRVAYDKRHALAASLASDACRSGFLMIDRPRFAIPFEEARDCLTNWISRR